MEVFWDFNRSLLIAFAQGASISGLFFVLVSATFGSLDYLLEIHINWKVYWYVFLASLFLLSVLIFLALAPRPTDPLGRINDLPFAYKIQLLYLSIPFSLIYMTILYLYGLKIIATLSLPKGLVGWLVCGFSLCSTLTWLLSYPLRDSENKMAIFFRRYLFHLLLPVLCLLGLAVWERVAQYGITEMRYFLIVLGLWLAGISIYFSFRHGENIRIIPQSLCAVALLTSFGPWGAYSVSRWSQSARLENQLQQVADLGSNADIPSKRKLGKNLGDTLTYLLGFHGKQSLQPIFAGNLGVSKILEQMKNDPLSHFSRDYSATPVKDICTELGIECPTYYSSGSFTSFSYSIDSYPSEAIPAADVSGFDFAFSNISLSNGALHIADAGEKQYTFKLNKLVLEIIRKQSGTVAEKKIEIDLKPIILELQKLNVGNPSSGKLDAAHRVVDGSTEKLRARLVLRYLSGRIEGEVPDLFSVGGEIYIHDEG